MMWLRPLWVVAGSVTATLPIVAACSMYFHAVVTMDYLATGLITSLIVASVATLYLSYVDHLALSAVRESGERYRLLFEHSGEAILLSGPDGAIYSANPKACQILGRAEDEIRRLGRAGLFDTADQRLPMALKEGRRDGKSGGELNMLRQDGTVFPVEVSSTVFHDADGNERSSMIIRDLTEQKLSEEKLRRLNDELESKVEERTRQLMAMQEELLQRERLALLVQVADTVGHELRNPLGVMNNAVYFLESVLTDANDITREYLGILKDEIADAERIVSDLLDAVRIRPPYPEAVNLGEAIRHALHKCSMPPSVKVLLEIPAACPLVHVDQRHLHQILWNLLSNAAEAMPQGGVLRISADVDTMAHTLTISICDNGCGIAPEHLGELFKPLFTTKARRIGLGLVVVQNLTVANAGKVKVESEPGKGSIFRVTLPCAC